MQTTQINSRLSLISDTINSETYSKVIDTNPPIILLPFTMDESGLHIRYLFVHEKVDPFSSERKTTTINLDSSMFESDTDTVKTFVSSCFKIPYSKISDNRLFYWGDIDLNIASFTTNMQCWGVNVSGLVKESDIMYSIGDGNNERDGMVVRTTYHSVTKTNFNDALLLAATLKMGGNVMTI